MHRAGAGWEAGAREEVQGLDLMAEELIGQTQVVVKCQKGVPLQPHHDGLHHLYQALGVLGEHGREGIYWRLQHIGVSGHLGRHNALGVLVADDDVQDAQEAVDTVPRDHFLHHIFLPIRPWQTELQEEQRLEVTQHLDILEHIEHLRGQVGVSQVTLHQVGFKHCGQGLLLLQCWCLFLDAQDLLGNVEQLHVWPGSGGDQRIHQGGSRL